jgi:hypothetical protein
LDRWAAGGGAADGRGFAIVISSDNDPYCPEGAEAYRAIYTGCGPDGVFICDECVELCAEVLEGDRRSLE